MYFNIVPNFGRLPTIMMQDLNNLLPAQTDNAVNNTTPIRPAIGCQIGRVTGVACLTSISMGVKGGKRETQVAMLPRGAWITGKSSSMGNIKGNMAGN